MDQKILFIGTNAQAREFARDRGIKDRITLSGKAEVEYCALKDTLDVAISGSDTPEKEETWRLPEIVIYTGQIREYDPDARVGANATLNVPGIIEFFLEKYRPPVCVKVDMECP